MLPSSAGIKKKCTDINTLHGLAMLINQPQGLQIGDIDWSRCCWCQSLMSEVAPVPSLHPYLLPDPPGQELSQKECSQYSHFLSIKQ